MPTITLDSRAIERTPAGTVREYPATGAWRIIVARSLKGAARTYYFHGADDPRIAQSMRRRAADFIKE